MADLKDSSPDEDPLEAEGEDFGDDLMVVSVQAVKGTEGVKTIRLRIFRG